MGSRTISGPGRLGSVKAVKRSLKGGGQKNIKSIPKEDSLTVRFLDEPPEWHGYYEHFVGKQYVPCTTDDCPGCDSDDPEEQKKMFRYLANAYVVDDQKVWAVKMPKSLVESLMAFYTKYKGTIMDRDYELSRTGSGQNDTRYMAIPESPSKLKLSRFEDKKLNLDDVLSSLVSDEDEEEDDDDDETPKKAKKSKPKSTKDRDPWDDDDAPKKKKKSGLASKGRTVSKKRTVKRSK